MTVTVYSKPGCVQCEYTKKRLESQGTEFSVVDVTQDHEAMQTVLATGRTEMPYVVAGEDSWHGFSPDRIKSLIKDVAA